MNKQEKEDIFNNIFNECLEEIKHENSIAIEQFNEIYKQKFTIMNWFKALIIKKILGKFRIEVRAFIEDKELFCINIPNKK